MFPLRLVRSLSSGGNIANNPLLLSHNHIDVLDDYDPTSTNISKKIRKRIPLMLFIPTHELVRDTYRLAAIARAIGMDLHPNPSLSHIIFSWPSPPSPLSSSSSSSQVSSSSFSWSLPNDSVPLPFPSITTASLYHLRLFANLSKGYFKLAFLKTNGSPLEKIESLSNNNWHCTSLSLFFARTGEKIKSMDGFTKALVGMGWSLFKTNNGCGKDSRNSRRNTVYLYRKSAVNRIRSNEQISDGNGDFRECIRVRELILPPLDFRNVPLRVLQYILLMTDDVFYLA